MTPRGAALRLSGYYMALFAGVGIHLPFWPVWLADRGLDAAQIGMVLAATYLVKVAVNPVVGHVVDRRGDRRRPMVALAAATTLSFLLFPFTETFWPILLATILATGFWAGIMPVGETLVMATVHRHKLDYGRVRLWGSATFIASATLVGQALTVAPPAILSWLLLAALGVTTLACAALPDIRVPLPQGGAPPLGPLLRNRAFLLFLGALSLNQAGHAVYYSFATLHWRAAGIGDGTIGLLWSEGVLAEILLFAFSGRVVRRLGPSGLIGLAAAGAVLRWTVLGLTTQVPLLAGAQLLHALSFGCAHLGAMHFIQRAAPTGMTARAQALYASVAMGAAPGAMTLASGWLYATLGGGAFLVMAAMGLGAAVLAWRLGRAWAGGAVIPAPPPPAPPPEPTPPAAPGGAG